MCARHPRAAHPRARRARGARAGPLHGSARLGHRPPRHRRSRRAGRGALGAHRCAREQRRAQRRGGILDHTLDDWNAVLAVNLTGAFICSAAVAPVMREGIEAGRQPGGVIVNIGSTAAAAQGSGSIAYATTKGGLHVFTKVLAHELGPHGIRVNAIAPGTTLTEWVERNLGDTLDASAASVPLRRLGQPEDVANAIAFLASDEARHITGQVLSVSGGGWMP
ncbi:MAG: SDR family oxidoreductase [Chloroflexi bacterium]|nr:SDR family oxidoreductase [Chloroflexota bacterium]